MISSGVTNPLHIFGSIIIHDRKSVLHQPVEGTKGTTQGFEHLLNWGLFIVGFTSLMDLKRVHFEFKGLSLEIDVMHE